MVAGDGVTADALLDEALGNVERGQQPLLASALLADLAVVRMMSAREKAGEPCVELARQAVALTDDQPVSVERVVALARLAYFESAEGLPGDMDHAEQAVRLATRCRSESGLAAAYGARSNTSRQPERSLSDAEAAYHHARRSGDVLLISTTGTDRINALDGLGRWAEAAAFAREAREETVTAGAPNLAAFFSARAAEYLLALGDWAGCRALLREALSVRSSGLSGIAVRLTSALLSLRCGQLSVARLHLQRAEELAAMRDGDRGTLFLRATPEILIASGNADQALDYVESQLPGLVGTDRCWSDELLHYGATAAAALATAAADERNSGAAAEVVSRLDRLELVYTASPFEPFAPIGPGDLISPAWGALFAAERGRCRADPGQPELLRQAVDACDAAGLVWDKAVALWRQAEALVWAGGRRKDAATALRAAHAIAVDLGAEPLRAEVESLATQAHISLDRSCERSEG